MRVSASQPSVEVHCQRCHVTFPVGRRRCLHCGGPLSPEKRSPGPQLGLAGGAEDEALEDALATRRGISPITLAWIGLLVAGYLYRACVS